MNAYGQIDEQIAPLTYDQDVYWVEPAWCVEHHLSIEVADDPRLLAYARDALDRTIRQRAAELGWGRWYQHEQRRVEESTMRIRRTLYECPSFREVSRYRGPPTMHQLSIKPQGGARRELPLRRLMHHGSPALGALHDDILYIVEITLTPA